MRYTIGLLDVNYALIRTRRLHAREQLCPNDRNLRISANEADASFRPDKRCRPETLGYLSSISWRHAMLQCNTHKRTQCSIQWQHAVFASPSVRWTHTCALIQQSCHYIYVHRQSPALKPPPLPAVAVVCVQRLHITSLAHSNHSKPPRRQNCRSADSGREYSAYDSP